MKERLFVTGGAGFIGSHLVDRLLLNSEVVVYDNLSTGFERFLEKSSAHPNYSFVLGDLLDTHSLARAMQGCSFVYHLAANADVRFGTQHPQKDLEQNTIATFNVLEAMRKNAIRRIAFSSTGSIYGEASVIPTPENAPFPIQTSLYGASKLACEGLITSYCEGFEFQAWIFRLVSILGERYTHGHVFDFYRKLMKDPKRLEVLGNGSQRKSYLYVQDLIDAMLTAVDRASDAVNLFNVGTNEYCEVKDSIAWITEHLGLNPEIEFGRSDRGWRGDNPFIFLDTSKIHSLGWSPKLTIKDAIITTLQYLKENQELLVRA